MKDTLQMLHGSGELLQSADLQLNHLDEILIDWERVFIITQMVIDFIK